MKTPSRNHIHLAIALGSMAIYALAFPFVFTLTRSVTAVLTLIPMVVSGWLLGKRAIFQMGILSVIINYFLFESVGNPENISAPAHVMATTLFILISMTIYWVRGLLEQVKEQAQALQEEGAALQEEIGKRKKAEERLIYEALHDPLTNLPNRRLFADRLEHAVEWNKRHPDDSFAVIYLDFDRFKVINDSLGHNVGDQFLVEMAQRLKSSVRATDMVSRMGGDEFAILLESAENDDEIIRIVERLQERLATPIELGGSSIVMTASIGIVIKLLRYDRLEDIIRDADIAMYNAKTSGKNRFKVFDVVMRAETENILELENSLRDGLQKGEYRIHYQPIMSLKTQQITGFEALLRWQHPERGLLYPADFIKTLEESGLIVPVGEWVLYEACRQMKEWQTQFSMATPLTISVNLSGRQFAQPDLVHQVKAVLAETGLPAESLLLELTEMTLVEDIDAAIAGINQLRTLGVEVEIDDYGTGYSSMSYLRYLPVKNLKIDRMFTSSLGVSKSGAPIMRAIIAMANSLDIKVIAEGIETISQVNNLMEMDCDYGQGFFFNTPLDNDAVQELLQETLVPQMV